MTELELTKPKLGLSPVPWFGLKNQGSYIDHAHFYSVYRMVSEDEWTS